MSNWILGSDESSEEEDGVDVVMEQEVATAALQKAEGETDDTLEEPAVPEAVQRGQQLSVSPGRWCEIWFRTSFRELVTPRAVTYMATVIGSFLNTEGGSGTFYIGLDMQGKVRGVNLNPDQKEKLRQVLDGVLTGRLRPALPPVPDAAAMADGRVQLGFIEVTNPGGCDKLHVVKVLVTGRSRGEGLYKVVNLDIGVKSKFRKDIYVRRGERKKCEVQVKSEREVALEKREEAVRGREMMMRSKMEEKETGEEAILGRVEALQGHLDTLAAELREVRAEEARLKMQLLTV